MSDFSDGSNTGLWINGEQFLRLWQAAVNLEAELPGEMNDFEWFTRGKPIRTLLVDLSRIGELVGLLKPFVQPLPDGRYEFGTAVNQNFNLTQLINIDPECMQGGDTLTGEGVLALARHLSIETPPAAAIVLAGSGTILDYWDRLETSIHTPRDEDSVNHARQARKIFQLALQDAGMIVQHPDGSIDFKPQLFGPDARLELSSGFRDEMVLLLL